MSDFLNEPMDEVDAEAFKARSDLCPVCKGALDLQDGGAHEYECGAFVVREESGPVWMTACPHDADREEAA